MTKKFMSKGGFFPPNPNPLADAAPRVDNKGITKSP
jgi:hypothetical protein